MGKRKWDGEDENTLYTAGHGGACFTPGTGEAEAGGSLSDQGQHGLHRKFQAHGTGRAFLKTPKKNKKKQKPTLKKIDCKHV